MVLVKTDEFGHMNVGDVYPLKEESKMDAVIIFYSGVTWVLFRNNSYEDNINDEFPNEFYNSKSSVPIYRTFKDGAKIGYLFPRKTEKGFKFIVSINEKINKKSMKKYNQLYYISSGFDNGYNIIMPSTITKNTKFNFNEYELL